MTAKYCRGAFRQARRDGLKGIMRCKHVNGACVTDATRIVKHGSNGARIVQHGIGNLCVLEQGPPEHGGEFLG